MTVKNGQRFIRENRAPRVHIEYELKTGDATKKIELPFVMGVLSDLSGKSVVDRKSVNDREFLDFDMDNFDKRMAAMAPRVAMNVDNALTGEGKMGIDLTFKSINDFSPDAIVSNVPALKKLLVARQQLNDLLGYIDGKEDAQALLEQVLNDPEMLTALSAAKEAAEALAAKKAAESRAAKDAGGAAADEADADEAVA